MTTTTAPINEMQTFTITEEILVRASLEKTFASLITQLGRQNETPDGKPLPMILEPPSPLRLSRRRKRRQLRSGQAQALGVVFPHGHLQSSGERQGAHG